MIHVIYNPADPNFHPGFHDEGDGVIVPTMREALRLIAEEAIHRYAAEGADGPAYHHVAIEALRAMDDDEQPTRHGFHVDDLGVYCATDLTWDTDTVHRDPVAHKISSAVDIYFTDMRKPTAQPVRETAAFAIRLWDAFPIHPDDHGDRFPDLSQAAHDMLRHAWGCAFAESRRHHDLDLYEVVGRHDRLGHCPTCHNDPWICTAHAGPCAGN
jgi:hypothetical protein